MMVPQLDKLVANKQLLSYSFEDRNDTGHDPYLRLELIFPDGTKLVVIPEGTHVGGTQLIGLYF